MQYHLGEKGLLKSKNWKVTAEFILLVNDWFDLMNSSNMIGDVKSRNAFGTDLESQKNLLCKVIDVMTKMRVCNARSSSLYQFQKGVILSCLSLMGLYDMLASDYHIKYVLTRKLNQDVLEHFFGCCRQMSGHHDHPGAVSYKYRMRKLLLEKKCCPT